MNDDGTAMFRVGLMLFTETGSPNNNIDGGYIRAAVRDLDDVNKTAVHGSGQQPARRTTSRTAARPA